MSGKNQKKYGSKKSKSVVGASDLPAKPSTAAQNKTPPASPLFDRDNVFEIVTRLFLIAMAVVFPLAMGQEKYGNITHFKNMTFYLIAAAAFCTIIILMIRKVMKTPAYEFTVEMPQFNKVDIAVLVYWGFLLLSTLFSQYKDVAFNGQGVRNEEGVVGIVRTVGRNYSVVLPIINTHTNLSCRFAKNDYLGTLQWDGKDYRFAQLADVSSHMVVNPGDTIVTSGLSPVFPEGIPVGIVESSVLKEGESYYRIQVRLHTHFKRLKYVEVVQNAHQAELEELVDGME